MEFTAVDITLGLLLVTAATFAVDLIILKIVMLNDRQLHHDQKNNEQND